MRSPELVTIATVEYERQRSTWLGNRLLRRQKQVLFIISFIYISQLNIFVFKSRPFKTADITETNLSRLHSKKLLAGSL